jgi:hypothetical protein
LAQVLKQVEPTSKARYIRFETLQDPKSMPGQRSGFALIDWPYVEGLRLDEAMNPLAILAVGMYGRELANQNGAPLRLVVPWKYGFKSIKSIVRISLVAEQPHTTWQGLAPDEYGFYANVNPTVDHPRWTQARERRLPSGLFSPMCGRRRCSMAMPMRWRRCTPGSICGRTIDALSLVAIGDLCVGCLFPAWWLYQAATGLLDPDPQDPGGSAWAGGVGLSIDYLEHDATAEIDRVVGLDRSAPAAGVVVLCLYSAAHDFLYGFHPGPGLGQLGLSCASGRTSLSARWVSLGCWRWRSPPIATVSGG